METKIEVTVQSQYGKDKVYPHNDQAKLLAALAGTEQLTPRALHLAQKLGFEIEEVLVKRTLSTILAESNRVAFCPVQHGVAFLSGQCLCKAANCIANS